MFDYEEYFFIGERFKIFDFFIYEMKWVFYVEYFFFWLIVVLFCCKLCYIVGYCIVLKNNLFVLYVDNGNIIFFGLKYIFSSLGR